MIAPADDGERRRLHDDFERLCRIISPSRAERACADHLIAELGGCGLEVTEDDAGARLGGDCGNLIVRLPGQPSAPWLMLCAHLDTVPALAPIEPVVVDGGWENAHDGILGADNKAAVAVLLAVARRFAGAEPPPVGLEFVFTVGEETALAGADTLELDRLRSRRGFVFDHASPIGEIVVASPTYYRLEAELRGAAAHAGIRPEAGRSAVLAAARAIAAMELGRLDESTTANVGVVDGGSAANVVPERCRVVAEARSLDPARAESVVSGLVERLADAANTPECECDLDVTVSKLFDGYSLEPDAPAVALAQAALRDCGHVPHEIRTGGGSDANVFNARNLECVNVANGTERNHAPDERVSIAALEQMLDVALALVRRAAEA